MSGNQSMHARSVFTATTATAVDVYEYIQPGTYIVPMIESVATQPQPCTYLQDYPIMPWNVTSSNPATYVVSPVGVVNYLSDMENHMALPYGNNFNEGIIYDVVSAGDCDSDNNNSQHNMSNMNHVLINEMTEIYQTQYEEDGNEQNLVEMPIEVIRSPNDPSRENIVYEMFDDHDEQEEDGDDDDSTDLEESPPKRPRLAVTCTVSEQRSSSSSSRNREKTSEGHCQQEASGDVVKRKSRRRRRKHVYRAAQGYLVEEPSESEEITDSTAP